MEHLIFYNVYFIERISCVTCHLIFNELSTAQWKFDTQNHKHHNSWQETFVGGICIFLEHPCK